jgi:hypothetical protein
MLDYFGVCTSMAALRAIIKKHGAPTIVGNALALAQSEVGYPTTGSVSTCIKHGGRTLVFFA